MILDQFSHRFFFNKHSLCENLLETSPDKKPLYVSAGEVVKKGVSGSGQLVVR